MVGHALTLGYDDKEYATSPSKSAISRKAYVAEHGASVLRDHKATKGDVADLAHLLPQKAEGIAWAWMV
ncbi:hypothetical protein Cadr_000008178 [Camelus dromedarius]|uniref:Uncharacterized protein n=1 Tax=Camelus dromedarius TaxID=9838 RepID=A0A5N4DXX1_CAMDR|nr:hypothetical protein Cadr_000008178 [Camelus dromedarius]